MAKTKPKSYGNPAEAMDDIAKWLPSNATIEYAASPYSWTWYLLVNKRRVAHIAKDRHWRGGDWWVLAGNFVPEQRRRAFLDTGGYGHRYIKRKDLREVLKEGVQYIRLSTNVEKLKEEERVYRNGKLFQDKELVGTIEDPAVPSYLLQTVTIFALASLAKEGVVSSDPSINILMHNAMVEGATTLHNRLWDELVDESFKMSYKHAAELDKLGKEQQ